MTSHQYILLFTFLGLSIFAFLYGNFFMAFILIFITAILLKIFQAYNKHRQREIEKEIYNEIKARKKEHD